MKQKRVIIPLLITACFLLVGKYDVQAATTLENQYTTTQIESPETWQAFLRRINRVRIFENDGSYVEWSVKKYFSPFRITSVPGETKDCPF